MTHGPQIRAAAQADGSYDFAQSFSLVRPTIERADLAIGNLETTFGGKPYSGYPMFSSPEALAVALREAGLMSSRHPTITAVIAEAMVLPIPLMYSTASG